MRNLRKLLVGAAACATLAASGAQAGVLFSDNFDGEHGGASELNYAAFANWNVTGQVDLVRSPDYGIIGAGSFVDLDGSSGPGRIDTKSSFHFNAGDHVTLSFDLSGNQRRDERDTYTAGMTFSGGVVVDAFSASGGWGAFTFGGGPVGSASISSSLNWDSPWQSYVVSFNALTSGDIGLYFSTTSGDNVGPVLDNVLLATDGAAVPEPATWALMIAGFGLAGATLRRRRLVAA